MMRGARDKAERLKSLISERMAASLPEIADLIVEKASSIAPTPDEEYESLMLGGESIPDVPPRNGDRSGDTDDRIRFMKPEGTRYIQEAIREPSNVSVSSTSIRVGNLSFLEEQAFFEYRNSNGNTYSQGPYFKAFLYGTSGYQIVPVNFDTAKKNYDGRLTPGEGKYGSVKSMTKSIEQRDMFDRETLQGVARTALRKVAEEIGPGTETNT